MKNIELCWKEKVAQWGSFVKKYIGTWFIVNEYKTWCAYEQSITVPLATTLLSISLYRQQPSRLNSA